MIVISFKVNSVGVSSEYYDGNPLPMKPGETKEIQLEIQNMVGDEDLYLQAEVTQGNEFATITNTNKIYFVPIGTKDVKVNIRVIMPKDIQPGIHNFIVSFVTVTPGQTSGTIRMGVGIDKVVPIRVNAPQLITGQAYKPEIVANMFALIIFIAVVAIVILFIKIRKKK